MESVHREGPEADGNHRGKATAAACYSHWTTPMETDLQDAYLLFYVSGAVLLCLGAATLLVWYLHGHRDESYRWMAVYSVAVIAVVIFSWVVSLACRVLRRANARRPEGFTSGAAPRIGPERVVKQRALQEEDSSDRKSGGDDDAVYPRSNSVFLLSNKGESDEENADEDVITCEGA